MAASRNRFAMRKRWLVMLTLLVFATALGIGAFLWQSVQTSSVDAIRIRVDMLKPVLTTIRFVLIALVTLSWPVVVQGLYRWGRVDGTGAIRLLSLRWRIVTWLIVIELILGQNLLGRFMFALHGPGT